MTLIEALVYSALLSFLLAGFIRYAAESQWSDLRLLHDIQDAWNS